MDLVLCVLGVLCRPNLFFFATEATQMLTDIATGVAPRSRTPARVLVVAGSDSGGGAGIQADIRACMANHAFASTAISALTAQNSHGVHDVHVPSVDVVEAQMVAVLEDIGADAVKTGMLPNAEIVRRVAQVRFAVRVLALLSAFQFANTQIRSAVSLVWSAVAGSDGRRHAII
jgi:hydroxymethylpyrimidine/phosphomethylpyrimidine kinase